jgi:2-dehydro-3-deoxyglucarate aldolase
VAQSQHPIQAKYSEEFLIDRNAFFVELLEDFKKQIDGDELSLGCWIMSRDPILAEILATSGFDWLAIDMEHSPTTLSEAADLIRVITANRCAAMVRLPCDDVVLAKQVLDAGACGIIVPDIRTRAQAERMAQAARYPRAGGTGTRGVGLGRSAAFGRKFDRYFKTWNESVVVVVQIEHIDAVDHAEEIASVEGVDAVFIGPYDLSASMGIAGQLTHPDLTVNVDRVIAAAKKAGKRAGFHYVPVDGQGALDLAKRGASLIAYSSDVFMVRHCADEFMRLVGRVAR